MAALPLDEKLVSFNCLIFSYFTGLCCHQWVLWSSIVFSGVQTSELLNLLLFDSPELMVVHDELDSTETFWQILFNWDGAKSLHLQFSSCRLTWLSACPEEEAYCCQRLRRQEINLYRIQAPQKKLASCLIRILKPNHRSLSKLIQVAVSWSLDR